MVVRIKDGIVLGTQENSFHFLVQLRHGTCSRRRVGESTGNAETKTSEAGATGEVAAEVEAATGEMEAGIEEEASATMEVSRRTVGLAARPLRRLGGTTGESSAFGGCGALLLVRPLPE